MKCLDSRHGVTLSLLFVELGVRATTNRVDLFDGYETIIEQVQHVAGVNDYRPTQFG